MNFNYDNKSNVFKPIVKLLGVCLFIQLINGQGCQNTLLTTQNNTMETNDELHMLSSKGDKRSNVIVLMVDDLAVLAFNTLLELENHKEFEKLAPHLRKMRDQSFLMKNSFVGTPLCCPSRATFLTGLYSHNHQVLSNGGQYGGLKPFHDSGFENKSIAVYLQQVGYKTGFIGKYLNGYSYDFINSFPKGYKKYGVPPGWDDWQGLVDPTTYRVFDYEFIDNGTLVKKSQHSCPYANFSKVSDFHRDNPQLSSYINSSQCQSNYQTSQISKRVLDFISESALQSTEQNKPFFLSITPLAPHIEYNQGYESQAKSINEVNSIEELDSSNDQSIDAIEHKAYMQQNQREHFHHIIRPAPKYIGILEDMDVSSILNNIPSFDETIVKDKPLWIQALAPLDEDLRGAVENQFKRALEAMLSVDDLLGELELSLQKNNLSENTIIIFTSDNGYFYGEHRLTTKGFPYEESIKVPLMVQIPQKTKKTVSEFIVNIDLAPTLLDLAGVPLDQYQMDGRSLVTLLEGGQGLTWRKQSLVEIHTIPPYTTNLSNPPLGMFYSAIRTSPKESSDLGNMLYVEYYAENLSVIGWEMYDLDKDPYQEQNLLKRHTIDFSNMSPEQRELRKRLKKLKKCQGQGSSSCKLAEEYDP